MPYRLGPASPPGHQTNPLLARASPLRETLLPPGSPPPPYPPVFYTQPPQVGLSPADISIEKPGGAPIEAGLSGDGPATGHFGVRWYI